MANKWNTLREKMTPEQQARSAAKAEAMQVQLHLPQLRQARTKIQVEVTEAKDTQQAAGSKLE